MRYPISVTIMKSLRKYYKTYSGVGTFMPAPEYLGFLSSIPALHSALPSPLLTPAYALSTLSSDARRSQQREPQPCLLRSRSEPWTAR